MVISGILIVVDAPDPETPAETAVITPETGRGEVVEEVGTRADGDERHIVGAPIPEVALPSGAEVADHISASLGHPYLEAACADDIVWACDVGEITVNSVEEVTVTIARSHPGVNPAAIGIGVFTFAVAARDDGAESPLPGLNVVTVMDSNGVVLARKTA